MTSAIQKMHDSFPSTDTAPTNTVLERIILGGLFESSGIPAHLGELRRVPWGGISSGSMQLRGAASVILAKDELVSHESRSRYDTLCGLCRPGSEVVVVDTSPFAFDMAESGSALCGMPDFLRDVANSVRVCFPFDSRLVDFEISTDGDRYYRFVVEGSPTPFRWPVMAEAIMANEVGAVLTGEGCYPKEDLGGVPHFWMTGTGSVLVRSSISQLVRVELDIKTAVARPCSITFHGTEHRAVDTLSVVAFASVIPGYNPLRLSMEGLIETPLARGISSDSREIALRITGASLTQIAVR